MGGKSQRELLRRRPGAQTDAAAGGRLDLSPTTRPPKRSASAPRARSRGDAARSRGSRGGDSGRAAR